MPAQVQHAGSHVVCHHQLARVQVHILQQRHHSAVTLVIFFGAQRILQRGGVARLICVVRHGHERLLAVWAVVRGHARVGAGIPARALTFHQRVLMRRHHQVIPAQIRVVQVGILRRVFGCRRFGVLIVIALDKRSPLRQPVGQRDRRGVRIESPDTADQYIALRQQQRVLAVAFTYIDSGAVVQRAGEPVYHHHVLAQHQLTVGLRLDGRAGAAAFAALHDRAVSQRHHRLIEVMAVHGQRCVFLAVRHIRRPGVAAQVDGDLRGERLIARVDGHVLRPVLRQQDRAFPRLAGQDMVHRLLNAVELLHAHQQHVARVAASAHAVGVRVLVLQHLHVLQLGRAHLLQYGVFPACCILAVERVSLRQQRARRQLGAVLCIDFDLLERTMLQLRLADGVNAQNIHRHVIVRDLQRTRTALAQTHSTHCTRARDRRRTPGEPYIVHPVPVQVDGAHAAHPRDSTAPLKQRHGGVEEIAAAVHRLHIPRLAVRHDPRRELRAAVLAHAGRSVHRPVLARHHAHVGHPVGLRRVFHEAVRTLERIALRQQVAGRHAAVRRDCSIRAAAQRHRPAGHVQLPDRPGVRRHRQRPVLHLDLDVRRDRALTLDRQVARVCGVADVDRRHTAALDRALADRMPVQVQHDLAAVRAIADPRAHGHLLSGEVGNDIRHLGVPQQRHRILFAISRVARGLQRVAQLHVVRRALAVRHFGRQLGVADAAGVRLFVHLPVPVQTRHAALRAHAVLPVLAVVVIALFAAGAPRPVRVAASVRHPRVLVLYDGVVTRRPVVTIANLQQRRPCGIAVAPVRQLVVVFQQLTQVAIARAPACVDGDGLRRLARPSGQRTAQLQAAPQLRGVLHRQAAGQMHHRFELQHAALGQHAGLLVAAVKSRVIAALSRQLALEHQLAAGDLDGGVGAGGGAGEFLGDGSLTLHGQLAAVDGQRAAILARQRLAVHIQRNRHVAAVERHTLGHVLPQLHPFDAAVLGRRVQRALQRAVDVVVAVDDHGLDAAGALAVAFNVMLVRLDSYVFQGRPAGIHRDSLDVIDKAERIALGQQVHQRDLGVVGGGAHDFRERAAADGEAAAVIVEPRHAERAAGDDDAAVVFAVEIRIADAHIVIDGQRAADPPVDLIIIITTTNIAAGSDRAAALAFETRHIGAGNVQRTGLKGQLVDNAGFVFTAVREGQAAGGAFYEDQLIVLLVILILVPAHSKPIRRIHRVPVQIQCERPSDVCVFLAVRHLHVLPQRHRAVLLRVGVGDGIRELGVIRRRAVRRHLHRRGRAAGRALAVLVPSLEMGAGEPTGALTVDHVVPVRHHGHGYLAVALAGRICIGHIYSGGVGGHGRPVDSALHERHAAGQTVRQLHAARHSQHVGQRCTFPKGQLAALLQHDGAFYAVNDNTCRRHLAAVDHKAVPVPGRDHAGLRERAVFHRHRAAAHRQGRVGRAPCVAVQVDGHCAGVYGGGHIVRHIPLQLHRAALGQGRLNGR